MKTKSFSKILCMVIILMMLVQAMPLSIFAVDASGEEPQSTSSPDVNITIDLNGGNQNGSTAAVTATIPAEGYVLTHVNVRTLLGNVQPTKASGDISAITTNANDVNNVLWGLFVDADGDGELDDGETLYRSGDTLKVADGTTLKCWYNPYVIVRSGSNLAYAYTSASAWSESNPGGWKETYTAQDLQALYWPTTSLIGGFLGNGNVNSTTKYVEIPNTVTKLNGGQFSNPFNIVNVTGLEQVTKLDHYVLMKMGTYAKNAERYLVFENIEEFDIGALAMSYTNGQTARFIFAGHGAGVADTDVHKILSCTDKERGYTVQNLFYSHTDLCKGVEGDFNNPSAYVYVPYGQTSLWYPSEENYASTSFKTQYKGTELTNANMPMREFYEVSFDLAGGVGIANITYMDARAVSVIRNGSEANMFNAATDGYSVNPAAQDVSILKAKKPADPEKAGYAFAGWYDQYGNKWDDAVWAAGGYAGVDYSAEGVKLTAKWEQVVTVTIDPGEGYIYKDNTWTTDGTIVLEMPAGETLISSAWIKEIFSNKSPTTNSNGSIDYNNLFFALIDEDGNEYRRDDVININKDTTLTCVFGNDMQYQQNGTGVALVKVYPSGLADSTATDYYKEHYAARDLQPMWYDLNRINGTAFGQGYNKVKTIELPSTVTQLQNNGPLMNLSYLESVNLNNIDTIGFYGLQQAGNNATGEARLVLESIKYLAVTSLYYGNNKDLDRRFVFAGHGAGVTDAQLATILGGDNRGSYGGGATDIFFHNNNAWHAASADLAADYVEGNIPSSVVYVPYGQTDKWYPSEALYTTGKTSFTTLYKNETTLVHANMPMREMYVVSFNLAGGNIAGSATIANTYMDARAVSVIRGGSEANLFESVNGSYVMNPAAQQLALLKAEKPADPTKAGYVFAGWKDQNGHIWSEEDWANGGYAYDYGADGAQLTAVWEESVCDHTYGDNGVCTACGTTLTFSNATLSLGSNISMVFFVDADTLNGYANYQVAAEFNGASYILKGTSDEVNGKEGYIYTFDNLNPALMGNTISLVLSVSNDEGVTSVSGPKFEYSVKQYAQNTLPKADDALKTVIMDVLNYGAAAQLYVDANTAASELVTADFAAYASYASEVVDKNTLTSALGATGNGTTVSWMGAGLVFKDSVSVNFLFHIAEGVDVNTLSATINCGSYSATVAAKDFEIVTIQGVEYYSLNTGFIDVCDLDQTITVTIGQSVLTYSVETFVKTSTEGINDLSNALYRYIVSANGYFNK